MDTYIDTHCHLFWEHYSEDLDEVLLRASEAGVTRCIVPAVDLETMEHASAIAAGRDNVFSTAGVHPHDVAKAPAGYVERLREFAVQNEVVAIGEIGLDYHYDFTTPAQQHTALHAQLELALDLSLPVVLHNRESDDDLLNICREHQNGSLRGQFHCFGSSPAYAEKVLELGFHISFTGNVTYKKSTLDDVLSVIPDNRLLIETDSPFMVPMPHRGKIKRNEPSWLPLIAERYALARKQSVSQIAEITTRNACELFGLENNHSTNQSPA